MDLLFYILLVRCNKSPPYVFINSLYAALVLVLWIQILGLSVSFYFTTNTDCCKILISPQGPVKSHLILFKYLHFDGCVVCHSNTQTLYLQVSDLEARGKALPSELSDVIIAQVQGFQRNQPSGPPAVYAADLIMMSGK